MQTKKIIDDNMNWNPSSENKVFNFSVVMAIYNTQDFLKEAIDSIINQTLDFKENIQLILVNDGSKDNSLQICEEYHEKYPENIKIITQENSGQATARNNGLKHVCGKYVNFLDSDDYFSPETFENVFEFFKRHDTHTDVVSVPIRFFGRREAEHPLNFKYEKNRVIDLKKEPYNPQYHANSSFFNEEVLREIQFPTDVIPSEDAILINKILLKKKTLGVVKDGYYHYRKRNNKTSTLDLTHDKTIFFTPRLKKYFLRLIEYALDNYGEIPKFLEYTIAHDLYRLFEQPDMFTDNEDEIKEFYFYLKKVISHISNDTIKNLKIYDNNIKTYYLFLKNGEKHIDINNSQVSLMCGDNEIDRINYHRFWLDIAKINGNEFNIAGSYRGLIDNRYLSIEAVNELSNGKIIHAIAKNKYYPSRDGVTYLSQKWQYSFNFDIIIPIDPNLENTISLQINFHKDGGNTNFDKSNIIPITLEIHFENYADLYPFSNYSIYDSNILLFDNNQFKLSKYSYKKMLKYEYHCIKKINEKKLPEYLHIISIRLIHLITYPFLRSIIKNRPIYLFMDRKDGADDNAKVLWEYSLSQSDNIRKYFVVDKDSKDYSKLSKKGKVISFGSYKHKLLFLLADKLISSHPEDDTINPYFSKKHGHDLRRMICGLYTLDIIFLQHGVIQNNISYWLSKFDKNVSYFLTSSEYEMESLVENLNYSRDVYHVLGLPRFDNLESHHSKQILICPTWRFMLMGDSLTDKFRFLSSEYYNDLNELLNSKELINLAEENNCKLIFKPHPRLTNTIEDTEERYVDMLDVDENIKIDYDTTYNELLCNCELMITDYSSVAFDFAYLNKTLIYYQPNDDLPHEEGYFDYENMGFGDVVFKLEDLIQKVEEIIKNDFTNKKKYSKRVTTFFKYHDKNNSKRVYESIKDLK